MKTIYLLALGLPLLLTGCAVDEGYNGNGYWSYNNSFDALAHNDYRGSYYQNGGYNRSVNHHGGTKVAGDSGASQQSRGETVTHSGDGGHGTSPIAKAGKSPNAATPKRPKAPHAILSEH